MGLMERPVALASRRLKIMLKNIPPKGRHQLVVSQPVLSGGLQRNLVKRLGLAALLKLKGINYPIGPWGGSILRGVRPISIPCGRLFPFPSSQREVERA